MVRRSVLPGGVRVLTEAMPGQRSATIGFWVGVGSRDEAAGQHGSTHFLEHLLFKGTKRRTALEIASAFDEVGGESNAATAKESTCYYARVLDTDLPMAIDVIADMITGAVLDPQETGAGTRRHPRRNRHGQRRPHRRRARKIRCRRARQASAGPAHRRHPGGHPAVARDSVWDHYQRYYRPDELVITAAGGLDHDVVCALVLDALDSAGWHLEAGAAPVPRPPHGRAAGSRHRRTACVTAARWNRPTSSWAARPSWPPMNAAS